MQLNEFFVKSIPSGKLLRYNGAIDKWSLGGIHFEKNRYDNFKIHRLFSGMGNIGFYIAVIIFKGTSYMEIMGRNYTSIGCSSFYSHLLAC